MSGPIPSDLDGNVVAIDSEGNWAYRVSVFESKLYEQEYTAVAVEVATSEAAFRRVVFGAVVDKRLRSADLSLAEREVLERTIERDVYRESTPLSDAFKNLLSILGLEMETVRNSHVLWYDDQPYRFRLYVNGGE